MAEANTIQAPARVAPALPLGQARIAGQVASVRKSGQVFLTLLTLPAADRFSQPGTVLVRSSERLGGAGDEVSVVVAVTGYRRKVEPKNGDAPYFTADNALSFVASA